MWPWEHLALGYLLFSAIGHLLPGFDPDDRAALILLVFTQFPDLVDKPLAWAFGVFPSGQSVAHSAFVAVPIAAGALVVGRRSGRPVAGLAVAVGYLSHLLGDLAYPVLTGDDLRFGLVLWPVVVVRSDRQLTLLEIALHTLSNLVSIVTGGVGLTYLGLELALVAGALGLWYVDGTPGLHYLGRALAGRHRTR